MLEYCEAKYMRLKCRNLGLIVEKRHSIEFYKISLDITC